MSSPARAPGSIWRVRRIADADERPTAGRAAGRKRRAQPRRADPQGRSTGPCGTAGGATARRGAAACPASAGTDSAGRKRGCPRLRPCRPASSNRPLRPPSGVGAADSPTASDQRFAGRPAQPSAPVAGGQSRGTVSPTLIPRTEAPAGKRPLTFALPSAPLLDSARHAGPSGLAAQPGRHHARAAHRSSRAGRAQRPRPVRRRERERLQGGARDAGLDLLARRRHGVLFVHARLA